MLYIQKSGFTVYCICIYPCSECHSSCTAHCTAHKHVKYWSSCRGCGGCSWTCTTHCHSYCCGDCRCTTVRHSLAYFLLNQHVDSHIICLCFWLIKINCTNYYFSTTYICYHARQHNILSCTYSPNYWLFANWSHKLQYHVMLHAWYSNYFVFLLQMQD